MPFSHCKSSPFARTALNGSWPGTQLTQTTTVDGTTYYYTTFSDVETINIIFNNGGSSQTADITGITEDAYFTWDGGTGYSLIDPSASTQTEATTAGIYAYYINNTNWSNVMCWAWIDNGNNYTGGTWPGENCTNTGLKTSDGYEIWKWTYSGTLTELPTKIIFNNGSGGTGNQTADLTFSNGGYYNFIGVTTGISSLRTETVGEMRVYNLQGTCVATVSSLDNLTYTLRPGIYIVNGKKIIIR